jgi:hypothetical protein
MGKFNRKAASTFKRITALQKMTVTRLNTETGFFVVPPTSGVALKKLQKYAEGIIQRVIFKLSAGEDIDGLVIRFRNSGKDMQMTLEEKNQDLMERLTVEMTPNSFLQRDIKKYLASFVQKRTSVHGQLVESMVPSLVLNQLQVARDGSDRQVVIPKDIQNTWVEHFLLIIDLVRYFRAHTSERAGEFVSIDESKVSRFVDAEGQLAGYHLHFSNLSDLTGYPAAGGVDRAKIKKELEGLQRPGWFIIKTRKKKRGAKHLTGLIRDVYFYENSQKFRLQVSPYLVAFAKNETRNIPSNLRKIWDSFPYIRSSDKRFFIWAFYQLSSTVEISESKLFMVTGIGQLSKGRRQMDALRRGCKFLSFTGLLDNIEDRKSAKSGEKIFILTFNKFAISHLGNIVHKKVKTAC